MKGIKVKSRKSSQDTTTISQTRADGDLGYDKREEDDGLGWIYFKGTQSDFANEFDVGWVKYIYTIV